MALLTGLTDAQLRWVYAHCAALLAPSLEDYGLTPLEAGAFGRADARAPRRRLPRHGRRGVTGLFFDRAEAGRHRPGGAWPTAPPRWDAEAIVRHGRRFDEETFR